MAPSEPKLESKPGHGAAAGGTSARSSPPPPPACHSPPTAATPPPLPPPSSPSSTTSASSLAASALTSPPPANPFRLRLRRRRCKAEEAPAPTLGKNGKLKKKLVWSDNGRGCPGSVEPPLVKDKPDKLERSDSSSGGDVDEQQGSPARRRTWSMPGRRRTSEGEEDVSPMDLKVTIARRRPRAPQLAAELLQPITETDLFEVKLQLERERSILSEMLPFKPDRTVDNEPRTFIRLLMVFHRARPTKKKKKKKKSAT